MDSRETSSVMSKNEYEVFLSFRGPDTRQGLTDCLYHALVDSGIGVFRDEDELQLGVKIDEILCALDNSKICIIVLSPTFAESAWCLREVERMVDMKKYIVPIFCHVIPDDVKLKTDLYANALTVHEIKHGKEQVQKWRDALKEIPTINGRELKNTGFIEFSRKIAKEILTKLKVKHKYEIENFVQVSDEVESALKLLDIGSGGCRFLGFHGMGGIGKTTLARIIFNQISDGFDCSCFLENIRESVSQGSDGLHKLQKQLLRSLDPSLRDDTEIVDGMVMKLKNNFIRKKVIIVLDDIDDKNHFQSLVGSFGIGSRIIFTTRNAKLHEQVNSANADFYGLEKKQMDSKQSFKLFSRHAFGGDSPPKEFEALSTEVISTTGGLPLALEVVGSVLHRKKAKVWRDVIKKLNEAPHQDVQLKLKISFDVLEAEQQEIFLDIACFFIDNGEGPPYQDDNDKSFPIYMWDACGFHPNHGIEVLVSMSLIKIKNKRHFWMHDQLRDLGRAIVKNNSKDHRPCNRLWMHEDSIALLRSNEGKENVEALYLDGFSGYLDRENFIGLEKLRFLRLTKCANIGGDFGGLIPKLRWLSLWDVSSFNPTNLCLKQLVVLTLFHCSFDETWIGWGQILSSKQLKCLTLSDCHGLISTPDFSKVVNLERLILQRCKRLTSIHSSVGKLQSLKHLEYYTLIERERLKRLTLPEGIGCLASLTRLRLEDVAHLHNCIGELVKLKHLSLEYCQNLLVLPDSIGDLRSLISLNLFYVGISELPTTIGRLAKLQSLHLGFCKGLQRLPDSIGSLFSLIDLDMQRSPIVELPHSIGNLASLQKLNLSSSHISSLPDSFGNLHSLIDLNLMGSPIVELPHSFGNLASLRKLCLSHSLISALPDSFGNLHLLIDLDMQRSPIVELPHSIGNLASLQKLYLFNSHISSLPDSFGNLHSLIDLDMQGSPIVELPHSFGNLASLQKLYLFYSHISSLPDSFGNLHSLIDLDMQGSPIVELPHSFGNLASLQKLNLAYSHISSLPDSFGNLHSLIDLDMQRSPIVELPHSFGNLTSLQKLNLSNSHISSLPDSFGNLHSLIDLNMKCSPIVELPHSIGNLASLQKLNLSYSDISSLPDSFGNLHSLIDLNLLVSPIVELPHSFGNLTSLQELDLSYSDISSLPDSFGNLHSLIDLNMKCSPIVELPHSIGNPASLQKLNLSYSDISSLPDSFGNLHSLIDLDMQGSPIVELPHSIGNLASLQELDLSDSPISSLPDSFGNLHSLIDLNMKCSRIVELPYSIGNLASLQKLNLSDSHISSLPDSFGNLHSLIDLNLLGSPIVELPHSFGNLASLRKFYLSHSLISSLPKMRNCKCEFLTKLPWEN